MAKLPEKLLHVNNSSQSTSIPSILDLDLSLPPQSNLLSGSSTQAHGIRISDHHQLSEHNNGNHSVSSIYFPSYNTLRRGSSGPSSAYHGVRPKAFGLDARLSDSTKYPKRGKTMKCRMDNVFGHSKSRQGNPNRGEVRYQRFQSLDRGAQVMKFGTSNNETVKEEISNIPRNMLWMVDLSKLSGLEVVAKLANSHSGFQNVIRDTKKLKAWPDLLVLTVKLLAKVCDADFKENKCSVLAQACHPEFLDQLADFMSNLPLDRYVNAYDVDNFLLNVLTFSKGVMILLPYTASERFRKILLFVDTTIRGFELYQKKGIRDDVKELHHSLQLQLNKTTAETREKRVNVSSRSELLSAQAPPNDFRAINLIPTPEDIFSEEQAFVRPNLIHGAYTSVEHYLDVQFRLLHEDFLYPIREGITEYVKKVEFKKLPKGKPVTNVRLYREVMFLNPRVVSDRIGIVVNFDPKKRLKRIQWSHSKRFMYGSLLCFTQDNFR
jgi:hypothetical protein